MTEKELWEILRERLGIGHKWTKDKMKDCASIFMENIQNYYYNYSGQYRSENLRRAIEKYTDIEVDIGRLESHHRRIIRKFDKWFKGKSWLEDIYLKTDLIEAFLEGYVEGSNEKNS